MKNIVNSKPQLVTRVIYLIPILLVYTIGVCVAHVLSSESDVSLANIGNDKLHNHNIQSAPDPVRPEKSSAAGEITPLEDVLRNLARTDAAKALQTTRQAVLNELQINVSNSLYAYKPDNSNPQQIADHDGSRSLESTRRMVMNELQEKNVNPLYAIIEDYNKQQLASNNDAARSLDATRKMVLASLKGNVNDLFHDEMQYLGDPKPDDQRLAAADRINLVLPHKAASEITDRTQ